VAAWLAAHADSLNWIRQASAMPTLGFILGHDGSANDPQLWPQYCTPFWNAGTDQFSHQALTSVLLPHLNELVLLSTILSADSRTARHSGDVQRSLRDLAAMHGLARQVAEETFVMSGLEALRIRFDALRESQRLLTDATLTVDVADLQRLAHEVAGPQTAADLMNLTGERLNFHDVVQSAYTDNGHGDGRLTAEGVRLLARIWRQADPPLSEGLTFAALQPLLSLPRREIVAEFDRMIDLAEANLHRPMRQAIWGEYERRGQEMRASPVERLRWQPLTMWLPAVSGCQTRAERYLGRRDGLLVGIALELYRRQYGEYPHTLAPLVPLLLPAIPADRITGENVHYRLINGRPVVYSVGADRKDDGGRAAPTPADRDPEWDVADWSIAPEKARDGDWILYPAPGVKE
jgi:hypothetical protein